MAMRSTRRINDYLAGLLSDRRPQVQSPQFTPATPPEPMGVWSQVQNKIPLPPQSLGSPTELPRVKSSPVRELAAADQSVTAIPPSVPKPDPFALDPKVKQWRDRLLKEQEAEVERNQQLRGMLSRQKEQLDISPLLALADSWYGGDISKGYQRPQTMQQRVAADSDLTERVRKGKKDIVSQLEQAQGARALANMMRQGRFEQTFQEKAAKEISDVIDNRIFQAGKSGDFLEVETAFDQMEKGFSPDAGFVEYQAALGSFARNVAKEKGVLSKEDIERVSPPNGS